MIIAFSLKQRLLAGGLDLEPLLQRTEYLAAFKAVCYIPQWLPQITASALAMASINASSTAKAIITTTTQGS